MVHFSSRGALAPTPRGDGHVVAPAARKQAVLLVDDDMEVLNSYGRFLDRRLPNIQILRAESGPRALDVLGRQPVDLVIADFRMPGMDGIEFLIRARGLYPTMKQILFTAFSEPAIHARAKKEANLDEFFSKDADPEVLVGRIVRMLAT